MSDDSAEIYVSLWKQRLFELGVVLVLIIIGLDIIFDEVPYFLEVLFVAIALISFILQIKKDHRFFRLTQDKLEFRSPVFIGRDRIYKIEEIVKIEEVGSLYRTLRIYMKNGNVDNIVLQRFLGFCYSEKIGDSIREMFRKSDIPYSVQQT